MNAKSDKILLNRIIYAQFILLAPIIFLLIVAVFSNLLPVGFLDFVANLFSYLYTSNEQASKYLSPGIDLLQNEIALIAYLILWITSLILLFKQKKIGAQLFYLLIGFDLVNYASSGEEILTPLMNVITSIELLLSGMIIYLISFSSIKNNFK